MSSRLPGKETELWGHRDGTLCLLSSEGLDTSHTPHPHHDTSAKQLVPDPWTNEVDRGHLTWLQGQRVLEADLTVPPAVPQVSEGSQGQSQLGGYSPGMEGGGHPWTCALARKMSGEDEEKGEKILGVKERLSPLPL